MRIAADGVVPLEHQHAFTAVLRERRRGREPTDAGANDDGVPAWVKRELFVGGHASRAYPFGAVAPIVQRSTPRAGRPAIAPSGPQCAWVCTMPSVGSSGLNCLWHVSHVSTILPLAATSSSKFLPLAAFMALIAASDIA